MLVILSPSKTQDFEDYSLPTGVETSTPLFQNEIKDLIKLMKEMSPQEISKLMSLSDQLTDLNFQRYQEFNPEKFTSKNSKPSLLAFQGDVYRDIKSEEYTPKDWKYADQHLRIISGLYGLLKPTDLIQPYRLEMKTKLKTKETQDLYEFWDKKLAKQIEASDQNILINLASNEYSKAILPHLEKTKVIDISFKDKKKYKYRVIAIYSKYARGNMANQIVKQKLSKSEQLKKLNINGYTFNSKLSSENEYIFTRSSS